LAAVATDVLGKRGRDMLQALIGGEQDADVLAALARGRLRAKLPALRLAWEGRVQPHHRFLLTRILAPIDYLQQSLGQVEQEIEAHLHPFEEAMALVQGMTGIQATTAAGILAEIGGEMTRFPSDKQLACLRWSLSGHPAKRGQTPWGENHAGQLLPESPLRRGGLGH
jgi:transposase